MTRYLPAFLITVLVLGMSGDLLYAWSDSPYDRAGGYAFAIWLLGPALCKRLAWPAPTWIYPVAAAIAGAGWVLGEFNFMIYAGLALALSGFLRRGPATDLARRRALLDAGAGICAQLCRDHTGQTGILRIAMALAGVASLFLIPASTASHTS